VQAARSSAASFTELWQPVSYHRRTGGLFSHHPYGGVVTLEAVDGASIRVVEQALRDLSARAREACAALHRRQPGSHLLQEAVDAQACRVERY